MNRLALASVMAAACVAAGQAPAQAQSSAAPSGLSVGVTVALASLWDDETHLGRGPAASAEVAMPVGKYLRVAVEGGWFGHNRDAGYLRAEGDVATLMGRGTVPLGPATWRLRPTIGVGVGVARSTGTLTISSAGNSFGAMPTEPDQRRSWALTRPVWDASVGLRVAAGPRIALRPELRAGMTTGADPPVVALPLLRLQAGVAVEWKVR